MSSSPVTIPGASYARIRASAAEWLTRLEEQADPNLRDEFEQWCAADARHRAEFLRLQAAWRQGDRLARLRPLDGRVDADLLGVFNKDLLLGCRNDPRAKKSRQLAPTANTKPRETEREKKIVLLPGTRLAAIAEFLLTRAIFRRYVRPIIADMQDEYVECIARGERWRAHWVAVRGHFLVVPGWVYALVSRAVRKFFGA